MSSSGPPAQDKPARAASGSFARLRRRLSPRTTVEPSRARDRSPDEPLSDASSVAVTWDAAVEEEEEEEEEDEDESGRGDEDERQKQPQRRGQQPHEHAAFIWASADLNRLIDFEDYALDTYGITEHRDGFFDAAFLRRRPAEPAPAPAPALALRRSATHHQPRVPSLRAFLARQRRDLARAARRVATTRAGVRLAKSFLGVFVTYALCLAPPVRQRLGFDDDDDGSGHLRMRAHLAVVSALVNHPGRAVGAQLDGAASTLLGCLAGFAWASFGLWLSTSTPAARVGYGAVLAAFLALCVAALAVARSQFARLYQGVISAGVSVAYACLADVSPRGVLWTKMLDYGVPWALGQAVCLVVCAAVFPDAGARRLAASLHDAFATMHLALREQAGEASGVGEAGEAGEKGEKGTRGEVTTSTRRRLSYAFVNLSQAYRDLVIDFTCVAMDPKDVLALRNLLQGVIRALLSLRPQPDLFCLRTESHEQLQQQQQRHQQRQQQQQSQLHEEGPLPPQQQQDVDADREDAVRLVRDGLERPTGLLLRRMRESLRCGHAVVLAMTGYGKQFGPPPPDHHDVTPATTTTTTAAAALTDLRQAMRLFDDAESALLDGDDLYHPNRPSSHTATTAPFAHDAARLFAYGRAIRQGATAVEALLERVADMERRGRIRPWLRRVHAPSYPWRKALNRTNPQVRHDRGGVTAGSYYRTFAEIARMIEVIQTSDTVPLPEEPGLGDFQPPVTLAARKSDEQQQQQDRPEERDEDGGDDDDTNPLLDKATFRYRLWTVLKRLQGFQMRFALKTAVVVSLLSLPAWLSASRGWWNRYESWWAVVMAWITMHPRVGGNFQDLVTRALMGVLGAAWSGAGYAAGRGNPFVMGAFACVYLLPMLYRYTQSSHPRSGLVGCLSFVVTSLALVEDRGRTASPLATTLSRGLAFVVGVVAAVVINWVLWPFVARHELRKALSATLFFLSVLYRSIIAKYIYYDAGRTPTADDVVRSEILEGRLREGFVRIRQLTALTRHEIRLRAPFDPRPYSALADACERFFEDLVAVRQSALFFHPRFVRDNDEAVGRLLVFRRDAVAAVLSNLYTLATALRTGHKVPKYLPSAAAARKRLMDKMLELEAEYRDQTASGPEGERRRWVQVYGFSYNESLTACVAELEQLERFTKLIVGEQGFDDYWEESDSAAD